jgi:imidazolonepropionase-like amidohydrolase
VKKIFFLLNNVISNHRKLVMSKRYRRQIHHKLSALAFSVLSLLCLNVLAADLAVTNVRMLIGDGSVIQTGTILINGNTITEVSEGTLNTKGYTVIDGSGMTAMPGFIDAHRHINTSPNEKEEMLAQLEAGYTTILSGGGPDIGNLELLDHINSGQIKGPRIIPSGRIVLADHTPESARQEVHRLKDMGISWTGEISMTPEPRPSVAEVEVLEAIVDEAAKVEMVVQVHAVSTPAMVAAINAGVRRLVHLPNKDFVDRDAAKLLRETNTHILATIGFGAPVFGVFGEDNQPRFRDGNDWPEAIAGANRDAQSRAIGNEIGFTIVNARTVWDEGVVLGYCTDTRYDPLAGLQHELESYNVMFSVRDISKIMGINSAAYINMAPQLGTLAANKLADIVLVAGNPLEGYWHMLNSKVVILDGEIVVDKRD